MPFNLCEGGGVPGRGRNPRHPRLYTVLIEAAVVKISHKNFLIQPGPSNKSSKAEAQTAQGTRSGAEKTGWNRGDAVVKSRLAA